MLYWEMPFGGPSGRDAKAAFDLRFDSARAHPASFALKRPAPLLDLRFDQSGTHSLTLRGLVLRQNQQGGEAGGSAPNEVNWWIVGGVAIGAMALIRNANKSDSSSGQVASPGRGSGGGDYNSFILVSSRSISSRQRADSSRGP
ncbi:MAG: hypothetical protein EXR27_18905 [Betaproteobacteria bacterium]|nr:hypothetical protein [Betaproteobacteria bacterium]